MLDNYAASCVEKSSRIAIDFNHSGEVYIISEACVYTLHTPRIGSHAAVLPPSSSPLLVLNFCSSGFSEVLSEWR
jgi:hypothetical protein